MTEFKSRFRPDFDPKVMVFMATKEIFLGTHTLQPGEFFFVGDEKDVDDRRRKLLFEQRYMDYLPDQIAVSAALLDREKRIKEAAAFLTKVELAAGEITL
jgi:hypothetical protein